jgi:hypothetical protein
MLDYRPSNPIRVPNWRWLQATYLHQNVLKLTRSRGDTQVSRARRFISQLEKATDPASQYSLLEMDTPLFEARALHFEPGAAQNLRYELEARLLANQSYTEIEAKAGVAAIVAETYEYIFFDVRSRLPQPGLITHAVIKLSAQKGISEREPDVLWKMFAYWCGTAFLDLLIYRFNQPIKPASSSEIATFIVDDIREQLQLKAMIAVRAMPLNWQTQTEVLNLYLQMLSIEKNAGEGEGGQETLKAGIQALLENLPWTRSNPEAVRLKLVDELEAGGVGLRADELLLSAAGQRPPALKGVIESAVYPPRLRQTTVSQ